MTTEEMNNYTMQGFYMFWGFVLGLLALIGTVALGFGVGCLLIQLIKLFL